MLEARADFTLDGPGIAVHVRGNGPVLVAEVRGDFQHAARTILNIPRIIGFARLSSRALRATGMRVDVRCGGITFVKLG